MVPSRRFPRRTSSRPSKAAPRAAVASRCSRAARGRGPTTPRQSAAIGSIACDEIHSSTARDSQFHSSTPRAMFDAAPQPSRPRRSAPTACTRRKCTQPDTASGGFDEHLREYVAKIQRRHTPQNAHTARPSSAASGWATSWSCCARAVARPGDAPRHLHQKMRRRYRRHRAGAAVQRAALFARRLLSAAAQWQHGVDARN